MTPRFRRLLVIAPHPDDESIAAWAFMRQARRAGARVDVVVVSDGGASHPHSRRWPRERLVAERRREVRRVLRLLDVPAGCLTFLGRCDGALADDAALPRLLARTVAWRRPDVIVAPVSHDAHADHRAVAAALARVARRGEHRFGYGVWPEGAARALHDFIVPLTPCTVRQKRAAVRRYRTQAGIIVDADAGFTMTHRHLRAFTRPTERFVRL